MVLVEAVPEAGCLWAPQTLGECHANGLQAVTGRLALRPASIYPHLSFLFCMWEPVVLTTASSQLQSSIQNWQRRGAEPPKGKSGCLHDPPAISMGPEPVSLQYVKPLCSGHPPRMTQ